MPRIRRHQPTSPWATARDVAYAVLGRVHAVACRVAGRVVRAAARVVAPFPWSCRLAALAAVLALAAAFLSTHGREVLLRAAALERGELLILRHEGVLDAFESLRLLAGLVALWLLACVLVAFVRCRVALLFLKVGGAAFAVLWAYLLVFLIRAPRALYLVGGDPYKDTRNELWIGGVWAWLPGALLAAAFLVCLMLRSAVEFYTARVPAAPSVGDRLVASLATHGGDRRYRTSSYWSALLHAAVLMLPLLVRDCGMEEAYGVPKGSGSPVVRMVRIKRVKKRKRRKKLILDLNSPILFYRPDIDESDILKQVEEETLDTYVASSLKGKLGKGRGGAGGWPHGMENARVRFIRLEYRGGDWDQDMGVSADYNFLLQFRKLTGFKIADRTEHRGINRLRRFPKHRGPPFVFLTGGGNIHVSREEVRTLRWYCLEEGGLIFADNGGGTFNRSVRDLMRRCFPELEWVDIANDDVLYTQPYVFPNGPPALWHHSGTRALGLKHNGRWIVFYHQGDLNDAWKTGHSGVTEGQAAQAYKLGVNVINYAFNQYMAIHFGD